MHREILRHLRELPQMEKRLSKKLHHMYAMELFRSGGDDDFLKSENLFKRTLEEDGRTIDEVKEAFVCLQDVIESKR